MINKCQVYVHLHAGGVYSHGMVITTGSGTLTLKHAKKVSMEPMQVSCAVGLGHNHYAVATSYQGAEVFILPNPNPNSKDTRPEQYFK